MEAEGRGGREEGGRPLRPGLQQHAPSLAHTVVHPGTAREPRVVLMDKEESLQPFEMQHLRFLLVDDVNQAPDHRECLLGRLLRFDAVLQGQRHGGALDEALGIRHVLIKYVHSARGQNAK